MIDDPAPLALAQPGNTKETLSNLRPGAHPLRLENVIESIGILGAFPGFYGQPGATAGGASRSRRQIEFIGDRLGLGNTDFATPLRPDQPWKTRDALIDMVIAAMTAFVKTLHAGTPATPFVMIWPDRGIPGADQKARLDGDGKSPQRQTAPKPKG